MHHSFDFNQRPFLVIWEITRSCMLVCRHCRAASQPQRHPQELTTEEGYRFIDQVARAQPAIFIITGGDPTQRPDHKELIKYGADKGLRMAFSPSATPKLLNSDFKELKALGVQRMSLSLDGASRETHNAFRGVTRSWDWTLEALKRAREAELPIQLNTTFTRVNIAEFEQFATLLRDEIKPSQWTIFLLVPTGRGKSGDLLSADELEQLFGRMYEYSKTVPFPIKTTEGQSYRRYVLQRTPPDSKKPAETQGVNDGKGFVFVSHTGEVCPSGFLPYVAGNVRDGELIEIYRDSPIFRELRDSSKLKGKCGRCEYKDICGGSRARAYALSGDHMAEEPFCAYEPGSTGVQPAR